MLGQTRRANIYSGVQTIMKALILASVLVLSGCVQQGWNRGTAQPRALLHSVELPFCLFVCQITASITSTESGNQGQVSGGDVNATQTYAPVDVKNGKPPAQATTAAP
jgi:hypothetical protein